MNKLLQPALLSMAFYSSAATPIPILDVDEFDKSNAEPVTCFPMVMISRDEYGQMKTERAMNCSSNYRLNSSLKWEA